MNYTEVSTEKKFYEILEEASDKNRLVVIDFYTSWCGPCKVLGPIFSEVAKEKKDEPVDFLKINCEELEDLSEKYNISSIPTVLYLIDKTVIKESKGLIEKNVLSDTIDEYIKSLE